MGLLSGNNNRIYKLLYLLSMACFMNVSVESFMGFAFMFMAILIVFLTPLKFRSFSGISKSQYIYTAIILLFEILLNTNDNLTYTVFVVIFSSFFVLQSVCFVGDIFKSKKVGDKTTNPLDGKLSKVEKIIITATSILAITAYSTSSPIYKINYWGDAHMYFTLGKSLNHGMVLYKDIYDHKGPYIYFLHGLASLVSHTSFIGVYLIEVIAFIVFSLFIWKTVKLFYAPKYPALLIPLQTMVTYSTHSFWYGDSAEELCLPLLAIVVYIALKSELNSKLPTLKETGVIGVISAYLFLFKYNFCALIIGYLLYVVVISFVRKSQKELGKCILAYLAGILIPVIPVVIYFGVNNAFADFFQVYFYENMVIYPQLANDGVSTLLITLNNIHLGLFNNVNICAILCMGVFCIITLKKEIKWMTLSMFMVVSVILFAARLYIFYYTLILLSFAAFGWVFVSVIFDTVVAVLMKHKDIFRLFVMAVPIWIAGFTFLTCDNYYYLRQTDDMIPQLQFAEIINQTEDPKILTFEIMDDGFYTYSDVIPNCKYCVFTNMSLLIPEHLAYQMEMISDGEFDYIITCDDNYNWDNYELVDQASGHYYRHTRSDGWVRREIPYYLYKLR